MCRRGAPTSTPTQTPSQAATSLRVNHVIGRNSPECDDPSLPAGFLQPSCSRVQARHVGRRRREPWTAGTGRSLPVNHAKAAQAHGLNGKQADGGCSGLVWIKVNNPEPPVCVRAPASRLE